MKLVFHLFSRTGNFIHVVPGFPGHVGTLDWKNICFSLVKFNTLKCVSAPSCGQQLLHEVRASSVAPDPDEPHSD